MSKAIDTLTAPGRRARRRHPTPTAERRADPAGSARDYDIRYRAPRAVTLYPPGEVITGRMLGETHIRGKLHHYRVLGDDGAIYLAPPSWLTRTVTSRAVDRRGSAGGFSFNFRFLVQGATALMGFDPTRSVYAYPSPEDRQSGCRVARPVRAARRPKAG